MPKEKPDTKQNTAQGQKSQDKTAGLLDHPSYQEILKKLDETETKANQNWDRILRMQAENENTLRRTERDIANAHKYAIEKFVNELLPIIDSLELCVNSIPEDANPATQSIAEGVRLTLKMFASTLEKFGVTQINPLSEPFDPEFHQAVSVQQNIEVAPNTVLSVLQKGYTLNSRLVRPALVVVSKVDE